MAKEPRENRVPIMMSEEELTAVDDWRFANRVATRSEAIRRLTATGLKLHAGANEFFKSVEESFDDLAALSHEASANLDTVVTVNEDQTISVKEIGPETLRRYALFCSEMNEQLLDGPLEQNHKAFRYVTDALGEGYDLKYADLTPFKRVNEWLRAVFRSVGKDPK